MKNKIKTTPNGQQPAERYDDGNIPDVDLPGGEDVVNPSTEPKRDEHGED